MTAISTSRVPEDTEAELSFLATCCAPGNDSVHAGLVMSMDADDFLVPKHKALFVALSGLVRAGTEVNAVTLKNALTANDDFQLVEGFVGLTEMLAATEVGRPEVLAKILKEKRLKREMLRILHAASTDCADDGIDGRDAITRCISHLADLSSGACTDESEPLESMAETSIGLVPFLPGGAESVGRFGILQLDALVSIPLGEPTLIAARPGCGKTSLAVQLAVESARAGANVLFISIELPKPRIKAKFCSYLTGVELWRWLKGEYAPQDAARLHKLVSEMSGKIRLVSPEQGVSWAVLEAEIRRHAVVHKTDLVIIDYFGMIGVPNPKQTGDSMAYAYAEIMKGITRCAKSLGIGITILAQLVKGGGRAGRPTLHDIADTDRPARDANLAILLYGDGNAGGGAASWVNVAKNRYGRTGHELSLTFDGSRGKFDDASTHGGALQ